MHRHSDQEPDKAELRFVERATFKETMGMLHAAIEVEVDREGGVVRVVSSSIVPNKGKREIWQESALMFHNIDEAMDAVDMILKRLDEEARLGPRESSTGSAATAEVALERGDASPAVQAEPEDESARLARILVGLDVGPPASPEAISQLVRHVSATHETSLPEDYLAFLQMANGADGELESGAPVVFWKTELLAQVNEETKTEEWMPGCFVIGSDAGDTLYGIDLRKDAPPERYLETDDAGMDWDCIFWRGSTFLDLLLYLGRPFPDPPKSAGARGFGRALRRLRSKRPTDGN
jgi:SMI1 / KNR4 family (SUKH-1)